MAAGGIISSPSAHFEKRYEPATVICHMVMARIDELKMNRNASPVSVFINAARIRHFESLVLKYTPLGRFLHQYGNKLRSDPAYSTICDKFLENVLSASETESDCRYNFKNHVHGYFLPRDGSAIHDDHIMMILLMTVEVITEALIQERSQLGRTLVTASKSFLCPQRLRNRQSFSVSNWLFRDWVCNSEQILDPNRQPNMIKNMAFLDRPEPRRDEDIDGTMLQVVFCNEDQWQTCFASNQPPEDPLPPVTTLKSSLSTSQNRDVVHSFFCDRLDPRIPEATREAFNKQRGTKFSDRLLGRVMNVAADKLTTLPAYRDVENTLLATYHANLSLVEKTNALISGLNTLILDADNEFTFEQIIAVCLVLSRCNNEILLNGTMQAAQYLFQQAVSSILTARKTLKNLWNTYIENAEGQIERLLTGKLQFLRKAPVKKVFKAPPQRGEPLPKSAVGARPPASAAIQQPVEPAAQRPQGRPAKRGRRNSAPASTKVRPPAAPPAIPPPAAIARKPLPPPAAPPAIPRPAAIARKPMPPPAAPPAIPPPAAVARKPILLPAALKAILPPAAIARKPIPPPAAPPAIPPPAAIPRKPIPPPAALTVQIPFLPPPDIQGGPPSTGTAPSPTTPPTRAKSLSPSSVLSLDLLEEILGISGDLSPGSELDVDLGDDPTLGGLLQAENEKLFDILLEGGVDCDLTEDPTEYDDLSSDEEEESDQPPKRPRTE